MKVKFAIFIMTQILATSVFADLQIFERKSTDKLPKVPNLRQIKKPSGLSQASQLKWYFKHRQWDNCLKVSAGLFKDQDLRLWASSLHLECLKNVYEENPGAVSKSIKAFDQIGLGKMALILSPFRGHKTKLLEAFLSISELALDRKKDLLEDFLDRHQGLVDYMVAVQRARYYRILGEIAWGKQANDLAIQNFVRSYGFSSSSRVLKRLKALQADYLLGLKTDNDEILYSESENKLWKSFSAARAKYNYQRMARTGVDFLNKYPGSKRATEVSEGLLSGLRRVVRKRKRKFTPLRRDVVQRLGRAPGKFIVVWIRSIYGRGYYAETLELAKKAVEKLEPTGEAAEALLIAGKSAYNLADWANAEKYFNILSQKYKGSNRSHEAHYFLGLLAFRKGDHGRVIQVFEKFLRHPGSDKWELQVRYWLWRSMKQMGSGRTQEQENIVLKKFPLTYYGLRMRGEIGKSLQELFGGDLKEIKVRYWWTEENRNRWQRINKLLKYGWVEEAEREIDLLPSPVTADGHYLRAQLWAAAGLSLRVVMELSAAIDKDPKYLSKEVLKIAFPQKHLESIQKVASEFDIDRNLVLSIIRQESGFLLDAVSPSQAAGLMQLVRVTAAETAKWLKYKKFRWPETMFDPDVNIRFGTHYLRRMIRKYKGIVPFAAAAYNVGPGNMDRWLRQREDLKEWESLGKQTIDDMWMDELPWGETSFYVKAILRNYLLYKIIFDGAEKLDTPVWNDAQSIVPYGKSH